jgi:phosphoglycerate kinase
VHFLEEHIGKVKFLENIPEKLPAGDAFLIENLRFWPGEAENSPEFAKRLAVLADLFVNDAFAVTHRKNASVVQLPKFLPAYAGFLMEKEITILSQVMKNPKQPLVLIFGGNKTADKIDTIKNLLPQTERVLMGSNAVNVGESELFPSSQKILLPTDWVPAEGQAMDIGAGTVRRYVAEIKKAATIIWNGPLGKFEDPEYCLGSMAIAKAVAESGAFTVVGGGETTHLINLLGLEKKISFLSTGGGSMLEFLAGKKLPGIEALRYKILNRN